MWARRQKQPRCWRWSRRAGSRRSRWRRGRWPRPADPWTTCARARSLAASSSRREPSTSTTQGLQVMKIVVMGSGGVGGYFGARLAAAGNDVTFVARGSHLEALRRSGLRIDGELGHLHLQPTKVVADASEIGAADAVI